MTFIPKIPLPRHLIWPDHQGFYGDYGGCFVPEILRPNMDELIRQFDSIREDQNFWDRYLRELREFSGRPTPITHAERLSRAIGGAQIYLKREDLNQTGAHKVNNVIGQGLLVERLGKKRVIAETGAGQHGLATATMAARYQLDCVVYMGAEDVARQRPNVFWMEKLGAKVVAVEDGTRTLKDAINEAMRDWSQNFESTHYVLGTACGGHPFPALVAFFQSVIGLEAKEQFQHEHDQLPDAVFACVGGGSNALGIFQAFFDDDVQLIGAEAGGKGPHPGDHAARFLNDTGRVGVAQGYKTKFLQDCEGQMLDTHSVSAGLDYVGVSPLLAHLHDQGRVEMVAATDDEVVEAVKLTMKTEGIIPALESAHGLAAAISSAKSRPSSDKILVNLSGRGDKDIFTVADAIGDEKWVEFLRSKVEAAQT